MTLHAQHSKRVLIAYLIVGSYLVAVAAAVTAMSRSFLHTGSMSLGLILATGVVSFAAWPLNMVTNRLLDN